MTGREPRVTGDSALLLAIPEAEPVIGDLRQRHDSAAPLGVPAHVTILFPFVPRARIDASMRDALRQLLATAPSFGYRFSRVGRFADTTVFLVPEPAEAFVELTERCHARWPQHPPYAGAFDVVVPHLTVGDRLEPGVADELEATAATLLREHGPVAGRATEVLLMTADASGRFATDSAYALATD